MMLTRKRWLHSTVTPGQSSVETNHQSVVSSDMGKSDEDTKEFVHKLDLGEATIHREGPVPALITAFAIATAEYTAVMNEQFIALMAHDPDISRFDQNINDAAQRRKTAMEALLDYMKVFDW